MAIKPDRNIVDTNPHLICDEVVSKGQVLSYHTAGSGAPGGGFGGKAKLSATSSGVYPVGLALSDVVSIDQTLYHRNFHKDQQVLGEKVNLLTKGWVWTDNVTGTIAPGKPAYLGSSGVITADFVGTVQTPLIGRFESIKDEDGYAKVSIDLP